jgi:uncharacterized membrane protein
MLIKRARINIGVMKRYMLTPLDFIAVSSLLLDIFPVVKRLERRIATGVISLIISGVNAM